MSGFEKFIINEDISYFTPEEMSKLVSKNEPLNKEVILKYLQSFPWVAFTSAPAKDVFTGEVVCEADNARSDGVYTWFETDIYYFDRYNLKLNDDFIDYVLSKASND